MPANKTWKIAGATAALAAFGIGGAIGLRPSSADDVDPINLRDARPTTTAPAPTTVPDLDLKVEESVASPLSAQSVASPASAQSPVSPASPASVKSPASPQSPASPASPPSPASPASPASIDSPASPPSPASPASVDSPD